MKKRRILSVILTVMVLITSICSVSITANAASKSAGLKVINTESMDQLTWVQFQSTTKEKFQLKRSKNSKVFDSQIYNDLINSAKNSSKQGTGSDTVRINLGSVTGTPYSLTKAANENETAGSTATTCGSTFLTVSVNGRKTATQYSYNSSYLKIDTIKVNDYEKLKIVPKKTGTSTITFKFIDNGKETYTAKVVVKVLTPDETFTAIKNAGKGYYKNFESGAEGAVCWPAANDVRLWQDNACTKPRNLYGTNSNIISRTQSNGKYACKIARDPVTGKTIDGRKVFVKVWDYKYHKYVTGWVNDTRLYVDLLDLMETLDAQYINSDSAKAKCSGVNIPGVTGKALSEHSYAVPARLTTAKLIQQAQNIVMRYGFAVSIAESYRPLKTQKAMADGTYSAINKAYSGYSQYAPVKLNLSMNKYRAATYYTLASGLARGKDTYGGKSAPCDNVGWFIASGNSSSSHQNGRAIDCTLISYASREYMKTQCPIQDLSAQAIITDAKLKTNSGEKVLNHLFTNQGMKSLITEWWHFEEQIAYDYYQNAYGKQTTVTHYDKNVPNLGVLQYTDAA